MAHRFVKKKKKPFTYGEDDMDDLDEDEDD